MKQMTPGMTSGVKPVWFCRVSAILPVMLLAAVVVYLGLSVNPRTAHACSCMETSISAYADELAVAFIGRQVDRIVGDEEVTLVFDVYRVYKGRTGPQISVATGFWDGDCGVDIQGARPVGIAAFRYDHRLRVGLCGSLVTIGELEREFGEGYPPDYPEPQLLAWEAEFRAAEAQRLAGRVEILGGEVEGLAVKAEVAKRRAQALAVEAETTTRKAELSARRMAEAGPQTGDGTVGSTWLVVGGTLLVVGCVVVVLIKRRTTGPREPDVSQR